MKQQITKKAMTSLILSGLACLPVMAQTVDLASGDSGTVNGAVFNWTDQQPTGTGYIDSFVRIQSKGVEQGYNTSGRPFAFDEKDPINYTHNVQLKDLGEASVGGNSYYQFLLDINETGNSKSTLSLDSLQFYTSPTGSQTTANVSSLGTLRYDLDAGGDHWILLDAKRNSGSGSGDMIALVPKTLFSGASADDYVYLYSKFGLNSSSEAGFEEWATFGSHTTGGGGPSAVPEPSTYAIIGSLIGFTYFVKRRMGQQGTIQFATA